MDNKLNSTLFSIFIGKFYRIATGSANSLPAKNNPLKIYGALKNISEMNTINRATQDKWF